MACASMPPARAWAPDTERATHYFAGNSGSYADEDAWQPRMIGELQNRIFLQEDNPMVEAVQKRMAGRDFWETRPAVLSSDAAAIRVRRKVAKPCREEVKAVG